MENTQVYSPEFLEGYRSKGDEVADKLIADILKREDMSVLRDLFTTLATNNLTPAGNYDIFNHTIREDVKQYFEEARKLPDWADPHQFEKATNLFEIYGPEMLMILINYSLPFCYSCGNGAQVLAQTGRLMKHDGSLESITRRLIETAQFVINVLEHDALTDESKAGLISIQKVRLIHATIRYHMLYKDKDFTEDGAYDKSKYGLPINQEDLAGTMLSFGVVILRGLEKMKIDIAQDHKEAFIHYWSVIGSILGIVDELIPKNYAEAELLADSIFAHQARPTKEGTELAMSAISFMEAHCPTKRMEHVPLALMHFFSGDEIAKVLNLPSPDKHLGLMSSAFFRSIESLQEDISKHRFYRHLAGVFSRDLIEGFMKIFNKGKGVQFHLPASLMDYGRPLHLRKKLPTGNELKSVKQAIHHLQEVTDYFKSENDPNGLFSGLYYLITKRVQKGLDDNEFDDPEVMEQVDLTFVSRYFDALNHHLNNTTPSIPWSLSFKACNDPKLFVDQYIFVATNAHMDYDLGIAVATVCSGSKIHGFEKDFNHMNDVFANIYPQMNMDIGEIWKPLAWMEKWMGGMIQRFENKVITEGRTSSWNWATKIALAEGAAKDEVIDALTEKATATGKKLIYPNWWLAGILRYFARKERGTVADKIDVMLQTDLVKELN